MRAVTLRDGGYNITECPTPVISDEEVLIKVAYAGVNRADLLQKQGRYPLPDSTPAIPGLEASGTIVAIGKAVCGLAIGDAVCALLSEGGYGEYVAAPATQVLGLPEGFSLEQGAALPEACFTAWISLVWQAKLTRGETVLIHGGASGIGTIAIQIARHLGAHVFATAGTDEKCALCLQIGAEKAINHTSEDFVAAIKTITHGKGVNVILDMVGGDYFARNMESLSHAGRLCIIAFMKGARISANLSPILLKHLTIMGSTLRSRSRAEKARIADELHKNLWNTPAIHAIKPVIDRIFALEEAEKALMRMDQGLNLGKILLRL